MGEEILRQGEDIEESLTVDIFVGVNAEEVGDITFEEKSFMILFLILIFRLKGVSHM